MPEYELYDDTAEQLQKKFPKIKGVVAYTLADGKVVIERIITDDELTDAEINAISSLIGRKLRKVR